MIKFTYALGVMFLMIVCRFSACPQQDPIGKWEGAISVMGTDLGIKVEIKGAGDMLNAVIDIPQQNAFGLSLKEIRIGSDKIHFELPAGPSVAIFDGVIVGDSIYGDFLQSGVQGTFHLKKGDLESAAGKKEEIQIHNQEEVVILRGRDTLGGTLTLPRERKISPAVILITGSGAQNRDEEIFGFKPFRIIAEHLTEKGIAVLRCDDRGVGKSTGNAEGATGKDFMEDVATQFDYLRRRSDIIPDKIGLLGHSEGATIAVMLASKRSDIAFIVLMAGTGTSGDSVILTQIEVMSRMSGRTEEEINSSLQLQNRVYATVRSDSGWQDIRDAIMEKTLMEIEKEPDDQRKAIVDPRKYAEMQADAALKPANSPWFKFFINYNPAKDLARIRCPILAFFGELDMQVEPVRNSQRMKTALEIGKNKDYRIHIFPKANHLFQMAETGSPDEYAVLTKEFLPGFLDTLSQWLTMKVQRE